MKYQRAKLSLHIKHPTRDLAVVCDAFGFRPAVLWKAGEERRTPKGTKIGGRRTCSYCSIPFEAKRRERLAQQLRAALAALKPHRRTLRKLASTGGTISFFVGWFCDEHTGENLDRPILDEMADLRIAIDLNVYIPDY